MTHEALRRIAQLHQPTQTHLVAVGETLEGPFEDVEPDSFEEIVSRETVCMACAGYPASPCDTYRITQGGLAQVDPTAEHAGCARSIEWGMIRYACGIEVPLGTPDAYAEHVRLFLNPPPTTDCDHQWKPDDAPPWNWTCAHCGAASDGGDDRD